MKLIRSLAVISIGLLAAPYAHAAAIATLTGPQDPSQLQGTLNQVIQAINAGVPGFGSTFAGKNYLDNGSMFVAARGTGAQTGGTTSGCPATSYGADRWCVDTNVSSGAGRSAVITTGPAPPPGFQNMESVYRNSGVLTQPVCLIQEIESSRFTQLQGKSVILSAYIGALAGAPAITVTGYLVTGTGTDQGLGSVTASPAITPAFTGVATNAVTLSATSLPISTAAPQRYSSGPMAVPLTATEATVQFCFTPGAETAGTTDGFAITGVMLEQADIAQTTASAYEFLSPMIDLARAERFYYEIAEPAASISVGPSGQGASTTTCILSLPHPVEMRAAPTYASAGSALANTTWTVTHVVTNSALSTPFLAATTGGHTTRMLNLTATTGAALTTGQTCTLTGAAGTNRITVSADF